MCFLILFWFPLGMGPEILKPVQFYIQYKHKFPSPDPQGPYRLENR